MPCCFLLFFFFYRRAREEKDNEDKTFKENLDSSLILNRARCYDELYGQELYENVEKLDCTYTTADLLGKYK